MLLPEGPPDHKCDAAKNARLEPMKHAAGMTTLASCTCLVDMVCQTCSSTFGLGVANDWGTAQEAATYEADEVWVGEKHMRKAQVGRRGHRPGREL